MVGRPQRKVFCQGFTRAGRRIGKLIPCGMKGYQLANGTFYCKYHGYQNVKGFKKQNYTHEQLKNYYENKIKPTLVDGAKSEYHRRATRQRSIFARDPQREQKSVSIQLDEVLCVLKKKSRT